MLKVIANRFTPKKKGEERRGEEGDARIDMMLLGARHHEIWVATERYRRYIGGKKKE